MEESASTHMSTVNYGVPNPTHLEDLDQQAHSLADVGYCRVRLGHTGPEVWTVGSFVPLI